LRLALEFSDPYFVDSILHLLRRADHQLISRLSLRRINRVGRQFQHTGSLRLYRRNAKSREMFDDVNYLMILIHINQIKRKQHAHRMDAAGRYDPETFVDLQPEPPNQTLQTRKSRVSRGNTQAEETFACLVIYAVRPFIHVSLCTRARLTIPKGRQLID
jgi:hypothetical protein